MAWFDVEDDDAPAPWDRSCPEGDAIGLYLGRRAFRPDPDVLHELKLERMRVEYTAAVMERLRGFAPTGSIARESAASPVAAVRVAVRQAGAVRAALELEALFWP